MIFFLCGEDTYRSRRKLNEIIVEFRKKIRGGLGFIRIDAEENSEAVLLGVGRTGSLFSQKELVIIENIDAASLLVREYVGKKLPQWRKSPDLTIIFWEAEVDAKSALIKDIAKNAAKAQEFKPLSPVRVDAWILAEASRLNLRLNLQERRMLALKCGRDLWAVANELTKVRDGWEISRETGEENRIWDFTDAFLGNRRSAFRPLMSLVESGQETYYLIGALAGAVSNLARIWHGAASGQIPKATAGMNPYVARKNIELARKIDAEKLRRIFEATLQADVETKTGKLPPPLPVIKLVLG